MPSLRQTCLNEVVEMPRDLAASDSRISNLLSRRFKLSSTGELERNELQAVGRGITSTEKGFPAAALPSPDPPSPPP
jgi:hypothetical protein